MLTKSTNDLKYPWEKFPYQGESIIFAAAANIGLMGKCCMDNGCHLSDMLLTDVFSSNAKKAMDVAFIRLSIKTPDKPIAFTEYFKEDSTAHSIVIFDNYIGDTRISMVLYYHFKGRIVDLPDKKVIGMLISKVSEQIGVGHLPKEYLLVEAYRMFSLARIVPIGINNPSDVQDLFINPCFYVYYTETESIISETSTVGTPRGFYASYKMFEIADTPTWLEPTYNLCLALVGTRLTGVMNDDIIMPHPCIAIELPENIFRIVDKCEDKDKSLLIQVFEERYDSGERFITVVLFFTIYDDGDNVIWASPIMHELKPGEEFSAINPGMADDMREEVERMRCFVLDKEIPFTTLMRELIKFVVNLLMYMNSQGTCSEKRESTLNVKRLCNSRTKKKNKRYRNIKVCEYDTWVVGTDVKLDNRAQSDISNSNTGRRISYSFITRGHWCNQAYGPNWSLRRRIWRRPSIKGKGLGDKVVSHSYKLDKKEK